MSMFRHVFEPHRPAHCGTLARHTRWAKPWERGQGVEYRCPRCGQGFDGQRLPLPRRAT